MEQARLESAQEVKTGGPMITQDQWGAIQTLIAQGHKKKAIARMLGIGVKTVRRRLAQGGWRPYERRSKLVALDPYRAHLMGRGTFSNTRDRRCPVYS